jgi:hypothetical protein
MARRRSARLPKRFPVGATYVVEARGSVQGMTLMHRYVRFPDGRRVELAARLVAACGKAGVTPVKTAKDSTRSARTAANAGAS